MNRYIFLMLAVLLITFIAIRIYRLGSHWKLSGVSLTRPARSRGQDKRNREKGSVRESPVRTLKTQGPIKTPWGW